MKRRSFALILLLSLMLAIVMLTSCSQKSAIQGKWQETNGQETLEFFNDGTVSQVSLAGVDQGSSMAAKYEFIDNTHIKFSVGAFGEVQEFSISGDRLTLKNPRGYVKEYRRDNQPVADNGVKEQQAYEEQTYGVGKTSLQIAQEEAARRSNSQNQSTVDLGLFGAIGTIAIIIAFVSFRYLSSKKD